MASNFKIALHHHKEGLHLRLSGTFDGSSAHELLNFLKKIGKHAKRILIHTNGLKHIHPFGRSVFVTHLHSLQNHRGDLCFTGARAAQMLPDRVHYQNEKDLFSTQTTPYFF